MYRNLCHTALALSVATVGLPFVASGQLTREQADANRDRWQSHIVTVKGNEAPSEIPFGERMLMAFRIFERRQAQAGPEAYRADTQASYGGSAEDLSQLTEAVAQNAAFVESVYEHETKELSDLCSEIAADDVVLTAAQIAERFRAIETAREQALESHYRNILQSLGPQMRASVVSEIDTRFVPTMGWGTMDHIGLAADFPAAYPRIMKNNCARWSTRQQD